MQHTEPHPFGGYPESSSHPRSSEVGLAMGLWQEFFSMFLSALHG